jgi:glycosyltransferase involved in cell wall biosynthesis
VTLRTLLVSSYFRPHIGGVERIVELLAQGMAGRGHDVTVLCCRTDAQSPAVEEVDGYRVERVPATNVAERKLGVPYPLPEPIALVRTLRRLLRAADLVHVQDTIYAISGPTLVLARRNGVPSVLTQHVGFVPQRSRLLDGLQHLANATLGRCARLATVSASHNPAVAEWAGARWGIREPRTLPVGVPASERSNAGRSALRRELGLRDDRFVALFAGRDVAKKGLDVFLGAADPSYELLAVCDRRPSAAPRGATIVPFMPAARLQAVLGCVDAFVLPSEAEGFPVAIQEALASGLPVLTTWQPGYEHHLEREDVVVIERNSSAIRVALARLQADEALRRRLSERALEASERRFGLEPFVSAYEELYAEALRRKQPR